MNVAMSDPTPDLPDSGWAAGDRESDERVARRSFLAETRRALWSLLVAAVGVTLGLLLFVLEALLNPLLRRLAARGSVVLALVLGIVAQVAIIAVVVVVSGVADASWLNVLVVLVVASVVISLGQWLATTTDTAYIIGSAVTSRRRRDTDGP